MISTQRLTLPDDTPLTLRPILPRDGEALDRLIQDLPPRDRRMRFHGAVSGVSATELRLMTSSEPGRLVALVATAELKGGSELIADARFVIDKSGYDAECALMVAAEWRRRGVGASAMAALLRAAAESGLRWLHGSVLAANTPMLALLDRSGFRCEPNRLDANMVDAEIFIGPAKVATPPSHFFPARWFSSYRWL